MSRCWQTRWFCRAIMYPLLIPAREYGAAAGTSRAVGCSILLAGRFSHGNANFG